MHNLSITKYEVIKYSSQNFLSSVNNILDFYKIEKNELILESTDFDSRLLFSVIYKNLMDEQKKQIFNFNSAKML